MFHVFKHHDERVALDAHPVEGDDVFVLQVGEKLRLPVEVRSAALVGLFQGLTEGKDTKTGETAVRHRQERTASRWTSLTAAWPLP